MSTTTTVQQYDDITFSRDCEAIQIPSGNKLVVPTGTKGTVTQTLGGSFTVQVPSLGALVRVMEKDLSSLLKDGAPIAAPVADSSAAPARGIRVTGHSGHIPTFNILFAFSKHSLSRKSHERQIFAFNKSICPQ